MSADRKSAGKRVTSNRLAHEKIAHLVRDAVFGADYVKESSRRQILELAVQEGFFPASIQSLYEARGKKLYSDVTVPAINIRGITYNVARVVFRAAMQHRVGAFIFKIPMRTPQRNMCRLTSAPGQGISIGG